ncbi:MAG: flagellar type III secretion system protein FlhB [Pseudomonadota bacterium]
MSQESDNEKTLEPTEKKKRDAARKGNVLRSREVGSAAAVATGTLLLMQLGPWLFEGLEQVAQASFQFDRASLETVEPGRLFSHAAAVLFPPIVSIGLCVMVVTLTSQLLLGGEGRFVLANLKVKGMRINPATGLKRIFGIQGLIELGKSVLKLILMAALAGWWALRNLPELLGLGRGTLEAQLAYAWQAAISLVGLLVLGLIIIAVVDYPLQQFQRNKQLKMSHQDMRDETKQSEGSPEVKSARRQRQRDLARGGVAGAMKDAQFVIVNPLHFAVALTYDPALAPAPLVLAKGRGETAQAMREIAAEEQLPILQYPALARAVYFTTQTNQMVREELYLAIASLVAFVMALKRGDRARQPVIEVPDALRFDADGRPEDAFNRQSPSA